MFFELQSHVRSIDVILNFHKTEGFLKEYQYRTKMPQPIVFILSCHLNTLWFAPKARFSVLSEDDAKLVLEVEYYSFVTHQ